MQGHRKQALVTNAAATTGKRPQQQFSSEADTQNYCLLLANTPSEAGVRTKHLGHLGDFLSLGICSKGEANSARNEENLNQPWTDHHTHTPLDHEFHLKKQTNSFWMEATKSAWWLRCLALNSILACKILAFHSVSFKDLNLNLEGFWKASWTPEPERMVPI